MGVQKVNYNKPTRFGKHGFREALCPACGRWVYVMSYPDDTRWRYGTHRAIPGEGPKCEVSQELIPKSEP